MLGGLLPLSASIRARWLRPAALVLGLSLAAGIVAAPRVAAAKAEVFFTEVGVPEREGAAKQTKLVRHLLGAAAKRAHFGKVKKVRIKAKVTDYEEVVEGDVLTIRCSMRGRLEGGPGARSHIAYSGKVSRRSELERKVLGIVTDGLVTRLAQLAREELAAKERAAAKEAPKAARADDGGQAGDEKNAGKKKDPTASKEGRGSSRKR